MDRRRFLLTSLAGALAAPLAPEAQQAGRTHRIGILSSRTPEANLRAILDDFSFPTTEPGLRR
jgi:hypothetical protein